MKRLMHCCLIVVGAFALAAMATALSTWRALAE
jgi:hypothetical protein